MEGIFHPHPNLPTSRGKGYLLASEDAFALEGFG